jgi:hypothetical protein
MTELEHSMRNHREGDEATVAALAQKTRTSIEVVKHLYDEEIAELQSKSTVKNFIGVIASRRARQRLMAPGFRLTGPYAAAAIPQ